MNVIMAEHYYSIPNEGSLTVNYLYQVVTGLSISLRDFP